MLAVAGSVLPTAALAQPQAQSADAPETVAACGLRPLKFDLLRPRAATKPGQLSPAVIVVHGGGWLGGSRRDAAGLMQFFAAQSYLALGIDYRLSSEAPFPAQIEDLKCAGRWLQNHAAQYGVDPQRIGLYGTSAGAQLAALAVLTPGKWDSSGGEAGSSRFRCAALHAPPLDLPDWWQTADLSVTGMMAPRYMLSQLFGASYPQAQQAYLQASPSHYVSRSASAGVAPLLVIQGERDVTVPARQARQFVAALRDGGQPADLMLLADADHFGFGSQTAQVASRLRQFFAACLQ